MPPFEFSNLHFRRQYLISPRKLDCPFVNNFFNINHSAYLYAHIDLNVTQIEEQNRKLILLGDLYDYENISDTNLNILKVLIRYDFNELPFVLSRYCGRFVILNVENEYIRLIHDAASSRKIYYVKKEEGVFCASQPHLIAKILKLSVTREMERLQFYTKSQETFELQHNSNIGNTTCYDNVYQVLPNHYFDYNSCSCVRYWPNSVKENLTLDEVEKRCARMIKGYMESICYRDPVMLPVTAGKDSRLLLAASRSCKSQVYYYINKSALMNDKHHDIIIPGRLLNSLDLKLNVLNPCITVDPDFEKIYFENNPFGSKSFLPIIYNYYLHFSDRINLPGSFSETGLIIHNTIGKKLNAETLSTLSRVEKFSYAKEYFKKWLNERQELCNQFNYNVYNLLYWEERMANWGTEIQLNKDIAQNEIMPFNSRAYIETLMCAPEYSRQKPDFLVVRRMTRRLWPQTMSEPYNSNFKKRTLSFFKYIGMDKPVMFLYYLIVCSVLKHFKAFE